MANVSARINKHKMLMAPPISLFHPRLLYYHPHSKLIGEKQTSNQGISKGLGKRARRIRERQMID
jgi:hypothetical protein